MPKFYQKPVFLAIEHFNTGYDSCHSIMTCPCRLSVLGAPTLLVFRSLLERNEYINKYSLLKDDAGKIIRGRIQFTDLGLARYVFGMDKTNKIIESGFTIK